MFKKCKVELSTKEMRVILLALLISGFNGLKVANIRKKFQNILKNTTGNWFTL